MSDSARLQRALVSGIAWTAVMRWAAQIVSWAGTLVAARLLAPSDYGIIAMASIPIGFARMVEDLGLDSILVQDRSIEGEKQARLAGFIVLFGMGLCAAFAAAAFPVAQFFHEPQVAWAVMGLSLLFVTDAVQVVPRAGLQRALEFRKLAIVYLLQVIATAATVVACARAGLGFKSLVLNSLAGAAVATVLLVAWHPFRIRWPRGIAQVAQPLLQGWRVLVSRAAYYLYTSADQTLIGRVLGKDALGAYSFAQTFSNIPLQEVGSVVGKVVPGIFSDLQTRRDELRRYFLVLTELLGYVTLPLAIGLALTADLIVALLLGPQWTAVVAPLRLLCAFTAFSCCQILVSHVMLWTGQFRATMWCTIFTAAVLPIGYFFAVDHGLPWIAAVWAVLYPLTNIPPLIIAFRTIRISFLQWLDALRPALTCCIVMAAGVYAARAWTPDDLALPLRCATAIGGGALAYLLAAALLFQRRIRAIALLVREARHGRVDMTAHDAAA